MEKLNDMKYVFTFLLLIHGFMHLLGFVKAFFITEMSKQVIGIAKPIGALWLITGIMFIVAGASFFRNKKWLFITFLAIILSQILIVLAWEDAMFGTLINCVILVLCMSAYSDYR